MSTNTDEPPALGARGDWFGRDDPETDAPTGHTETGGTDPAAFIAHQLALRFCDPVCGETERDLSEPAFYLPKQQELANGRYQEYRQHRHRCRVEPESGRINWGESTYTDIPEFDYGTYRLAVHTYLAEREFQLSAVDEYLEYADRLWSDHQYGSKDALEQFVEYVRDEEPGH